MGVGGWVRPMGRMGRGGPVTVLVVGVEAWRMRLVDHGLEGRVVAVEEKEERGGDAEEEEAEEGVRGGTR